MSATPLTWKGPNGGLGNRLIALAAVAAIGKLLDRRVEFGWRSEEGCPCQYSDLFVPTERFAAVADHAYQGAILPTDEWEPVMLLQMARAATGVALPMRSFLREFLTALRSLPVQPSITERVEHWCAQRPSGGNLAIHLRRTDRLEYHKQLLRQRFWLSKLRSVGWSQHLLYLLAPAEQIARVEDFLIMQLARRAVRRDPMLRSFTIYADSQRDLRQLERTLTSSRRLGLDYFPGPVAERGAWLADDDTLRETSIPDALAEILTMSGSSAIIQNNRASTFSHMASLIGGTPIISSPPNRRFWREIERTFQLRAHQA